MRFIDFTPLRRVWPGLLAALLAACAGPSAPPQQPSPAVTPAPSVTPTPPVVRPPESPGAAAIPSARNWSEYRRQAAQRIIASNRDETYSGPVPEPLRSIPVLEVHLNRDGSVRQIDVLRRPHFSPQTIEMAMQAIRRAAPFGPVAHLPQPWQFSETFLYNDELKFQVRSLVEGR